MKGAGRYFSSQKQYLSSSLIGTVALLHCCPVLVVKSQLLSLWQNGRHPLYSDEALSLEFEPDPLNHGVTDLPGCLWRHRVKTGADGGTIIGKPEITGSNPGPSKPKPKKWGFFWQTSESKICFRTKNPSKCFGKSDNHLLRKRLQLKLFWDPHFNWSEPKMKKATLELSLKQHKSKNAMHEKKDWRWKNEKGEKKREKTRVKRWQRREKKN